MKKADQFSFPCQFTGTYPTEWAGYTFLQWTSQNAFHPAVDWNWKAGEEDFGKPVQAIANGVCVHQSKQDGIGYGIITVIKHELTDQLYQFVKDRYKIETRNLYSFYAHLKEELLDDRQEVERGELIGYIGKSGTQASHLHQELYKPIPGTQWRYWPTLSEGWTQEKLRQYYLDTYDLVVNQPQPKQTNWAEKYEACRLELKNRDAEKRFFEEIVIHAASLLNTATKKDEIEKAINELFNYQTISKELWKEIETKVGQQYTYPDAKQAILEAVRSLSVGSTVPVQPTPVITEKMIKEFNIFDSLFIRIFRKKERNNA